MMRRCHLPLLLRGLLNYRKALVIGNLLAITSTLMTVAVPLLIPLLVDELLLQKDHGISELIEKIFGFSNLNGVVFVVLTTVLILRFGAVWLSIIQTRIFTAVSKTITDTLRIELIQKLEKTSLVAYETLRPGAIASKLVTDIETIDTFISTTVSKMVLSVFILAFSAVILIWIHWQLALFILLSNPIVVFFTAKAARKVSRLKKEENKATETFQATLNETLDLIAQIKASNTTRFFFSRLKRASRKLRIYAIRFGYRSDAAQKYSYLIFLSGYEVFRAVSILAVAYSDLSVGLMLAIFSYLWVMVTPTQDIITFQYAYANAKQACNRINELFLLPAEQQRIDRCEPFVKTNPPSIRCETVSFGYDDQTLALHHINLTIDAGSTVALVGSSGSGKSTLAHLLVGFYTPKSGTIFYGACPHDALSLETIRNNVHLILQHPKLFNDTMRFNLTLGRSFSQQKIDEALRIAALDQLIERLDKGLETIVGKDGIKLSGGERQRVAIARMVLADPQVIVLDESTSALDVYTEAHVFEALERFWQNKTVIIIAHRLSTIEKADKVYVLEQGRVVESGDFETLRKKNGGYVAQML